MASNLYEQSKFNLLMGSDIRVKQKLQNKMGLNWNNFSIPLMNMICNFSESFVQMVDLLKTQSNPCFLNKYNNIEKIISLT